MPECLRRGSRKHVLDLVQGDGFLWTMTALLAPDGIAISPQDAWQPNGRDAAERTLRRFCEEHADGSIVSALGSWWAAGGAKPPTWDLLSTCSFQGRKGLLLVEAKAHVEEMTLSGKKLGGNASDQSRRNHDRIGACIREAREDLARQCPGIGISVDACYQLSNRVASAWKLATCGLPVTLLYLGFTGDSGMADTGTPFEDNGHWQRIMDAHMRAVLPPSFLGTTFMHASGGSFRMLVKSMPVREASPSSMECKARTREQA